MDCFDLLIFDMDGVLVNTSPCHRRAYAELWQSLGIQGPPYATIAGRKTHDVVAEFTVTLHPSAGQVHEWVRFKQDRARWYLSRETIVFPDTAPCLAALAGHKVRMALGTGASRDTTQIILERLGLVDFFSDVATAEDVRNGKPAPDIYQRLMVRAAVGPERTLIIEDSRSGLEAALTSEAQVAVVRTGHSVDEPRFVGCFPDLYGLLRQLGVDLT